MPLPARAESVEHTSAEHCQMHVAHSLVRHFANLEAGTGIEAALYHLG